MLQLTRNKLDDIRLLVIALAVTAGILSWREAAGQGVMYAVAELPGDGVPCRLNNLGDVAGKGKKQATMWNRGTHRRQILGRLQGAMTVPRRPSMTREQSLVLETSLTQLFHFSGYMAPVFGGFRCCPATTADRHRLSTDTGM